MTDTPREFTPDRTWIEKATDPTPGVPGHLREDSVPPSFDVSRDPTPGVPDHAWPEDDDEAQPASGS
ncbi:MAG: hypothetical protein GEU94_10670 [Micromonosporaceae bacterium]|nr:hypothetical protein [Micromonosporaceae bacterium]